MSITVKTVKGVAKVVIDGELTIYTAGEVRERLLDALRRGKETEIDLSRVTEIDTAGLQLLILAKREAVAKNRSLLLHGHSAVVLECLDLCNLTASFGDPVLISSHRP